jgi:uncharacterized protein
MITAIQIPNEKLAALCRRYRVRRLALFGSALREDFGPDSDLDLLVTFAPDAQIGFLALGQLRRELMALFQRPVDLVPQDGLKSQIREAVLDSAELIYAA